MEDDANKSSIRGLSIGFREIIDYDYFLVDLWEDGEKEKFKFNQYKVLMDSEFT